MTELSGLVDMGHRQAPHQADSDYRVDLCLGAHGYEKKGCYRAQFTSGWS